LNARDVLGDRYDLDLGFAQKPRHRLIGDRRGETKQACQTHGGFEDDVACRNLALNLELCRQGRPIRLGDQDCDNGRGIHEGHGLPQSYIDLLRGDGRRRRGSPRRRASAAISRGAPATAAPPAAPLALGNAFPRSLLDGEELIDPSAAAGDRCNESGSIL
jgi:hypothetical protein